MGIKKIHVTVSVDLYIIADEDVEIQDVIDDLDYSFSSNTQGAKVEDTFILDHEITG
jgi:hypothetical protein